jgi:hypothetical protein
MKYYKKITNCLNFILKNSNKLIKKRKQMSDTTSLTIYIIKDNKIRL